MPGKMESTTDAEAMPTDQQKADKQEADEVEATGPKHPEAKRFEILFLECLRPGNVVRKTCCLEIVGHTSLIFSGFFQAKLEEKDVRIASRYQYDIGKECIHLSFYNKDADCVSSLFFEALNEQDFQECLAGLHEFLKWRLIPHCALPETLEYSMNILKKQPVFIGWVRTTVHMKEDEESAKMEAPPIDVPQLLVVVDLECVSWYENMTVKPVQQLMFWAEETPKSIETVKHHHGLNFIQFESKTLSVVMVSASDSESDTGHSFRLSHCIGDTDPSIPMQTVKARSEGSSRSSLSRPCT